MATPRANGVPQNRAPRPVSSSWGRGRGGRGRGRDQQDQRGEQAKSRSSEPSERRGNQGKHTSRGGGRGRGRGKANAKTRSGSSRQQSLTGMMALLPEDIVTQSLLPFFVWHDTSAMACVCKPWSIAVRQARHQHSEWKTRVFQGDNTRECMAKLSRMLGRGASDGNVRFTPSFALVSLSFADVQANARHTESVWSDLVDVVVAKDVLPVGCVLVGLLSGDRAAPGTRDTDAQVCLTVSIGHFANTTVETAAFDRKALRWSASGLTEELECPFEDAESDLDETSLLLWSKNAKPAQTLLELCSHWFPSAPVGGAVLSLGDHAPPLMTFTRAARAEPRRSKLQGRRKPKTTTVSGGGVLSCPSTLLLRLKGDVKVLPFSLCLDRPITPVLKNVEVATIEALDLTREDCRLYGAVAVVEGEDGEVSSEHPVSLAGVIRELTRFSSEELVDLKLYTSKTPEKLRAAFRTSDVASDIDADHVWPLPLYLGERGALTAADHWQTGCYGVVTMPHNNQMMANVAEAQVKELMKTAMELRAFGGFVSSSKEAEPAVGFHDFGRIQCHGSATDEGVGPLSLPSGLTGSKARLLPNSTTGFLLHR